MPTVYELSVPGRQAGVDLPASDVPLTDLPADEVRADCDLPELSQLDVVRHYLALSQRNFGVDSGFYPLGSCTMKFNPKVNEAIAAIAGFSATHPLQPAQTVQGNLALMFELQQWLAEIGGFAGVSLQPCAGAHGEFAGLLMMRAYFRERGEEKRTRVLIPDSAHGTNPASAAIAGFDAVAIKSNARGLVDLEDLKAKLDDQAAVFMITNPNTLGLFDDQIATITDLVHRQGALVYLDGANMNAILGITRPGDFGVDMMHYNVHKTFTGPHGAGGPGAGPIAVRKFLAPFLPMPVVAREGERFFLD